jgi:cell division transport system ATP-binding protein
MLRFESVSKRYPGGQDALAELSFALSAGEFAFLTGHSGAGKSTVLRLIALAEQPTRGAVFFNEQRLSQLRSGQVPFLRRQIGQVYQDHRLLMTRTTLDNVSLPLVIAGMARAEREKRARAALDVVGLLDRERALPGQLSAGEQQRVGVARAIVARPPLVIADEPTGNLDPELAAEIMGLFAKLAETGSTVLVASHDLALVRSLRRRVLVLDHGRLVDDFRPR